MDIARVSKSVQKNIAFLPGSRDRLGAPIIHFYAVDEFTLHDYDEVIALLSYYLQVPDDASKKNGFTVVIDMRKGWIRHLKLVLKAVRQVLFKHIAVVLIVRPSSWMEKQRMSIDILLDGYEFDIQLVSLHKLAKHIEGTQLPASLGGTFESHPESWCVLRGRYEKLLAEGAKIMRALDRRETEPSTSKGEQVEGVDEFVKKAGQLADDLVDGLNGASKDMQIASKRVEKLRSTIKALTAPPTKKSTELQKDTAIYKQYSLGVSNVTQWLQGAGEKWLLTIHEIGESVADARQLLEEHRKLANKDILGQVDELESSASRLQNVDNMFFEKVERLGEQLQSVSGNFLHRVNRQRGMCERSVELHTALEAHEKSAQDLDDLLKTSIDCSDVAACEMALQRLHSAMNESDACGKRVHRLGVEFLQLLNVVEYTADGHEITRDYVAGIVHVRQHMSDLIARRDRSSQLVDVRKLKLQQLLQLYTCETDCEQSIEWIHDLSDTLIGDYGDVGGADPQQLLNADLAKLEQTARSTFDYGQQLTQVSLVLRRSLRIEVSPQMQFTRRLEEAWAQFCRDLSKCTARLDISKAFHATATQVDSRLQALCDTIESRQTEPKIPETTTNGSRSPLELTQLDCIFEENQSTGKPSPPDYSLSHTMPDAARRLDGDVRELRHMADVLTVEEGDGTRHIRALLNSIDDKQRHLDTLIKKHSPREVSPTPPSS